MGIDRIHLNIIKLDSAIQWMKTISSYYCNTRLIAVGFPLTEVSHSVLDCISPSVIIYFEFPLPGERSIDSKYTIAPHIGLH